MVDVATDDLLVEFKLQQGARKPEKANPFDAGMDVFTRDFVTFEPGETKLIHTGLHLVVPKGYAAMLYERSSTYKNFKLSLVNKVGVIDHGYTGEVLVNMRNLSDEKVEIAKHAKIAQLVITPTPVVKLVQIDELPETDRGNGGFGSTGK